MGMLVRLDLVFRVIVIVRPMFARMDVGMGFCICLVVVGVFVLAHMFVIMRM